MKNLKETSSGAAGSFQGAQNKSKIVKKNILNNENVENIADDQTDEEVIDQEVNEADREALERRKKSQDMQQLKKITDEIIQENISSNELYRKYFTKKIARQMLLKEFSSNSVGIDLLLRTLKKIESPIKEWYTGLKSNTEQRELFEDSFFLRLKRFIDLLNIDEGQASEFIKSLKSKDSKKEDTGTKIFTDEEVKTGKRKYEQVIKDVDPSEFGIDDLTGYNFAKEAFKYVSSTIQNDYLLLSNKRDRLVYYQYLVVHLSYRFSQWSEELNISNQV